MSEFKFKTNYLDKIEIYQSPPSPAWIEIRINDKAVKIHPNSFCMFVKWANTLIDMNEIKIEKEIDK